MSDATKTTTTPDPKNGNQLQELELRIDRNEKVGQRLEHLHESYHDEDLDLLAHSVLARAVALYDETAELIEIRETMLIDSFSPFN